MEPIFTNRTLMDAAACRQFLALTWSRGNGLMRVVMVAVAALAAVYGAFQLLAGREFLVYALLLFAVAALALFLAFFGYLLRVRRYVRRQQELWGGPTLEKDIYFYEDYFLQKTRLGQQRFMYHQVTAVRFGRRSAVLLFGNQGLQLDPQGFGDGEKSAEFRRFIAEKTRQNKSN